MLNEDLLKKVKVIMIDTSHPGNIGGAARALKNMGLSSLRLVRPRLFPHEQAVARASGAEDVLENAQVVASLDEAIRDCQLVMASSVRIRRLSWPVLTPKQASALIAKYVLNDITIGIVFGNEQSGLNNHHFARCHYQIRIPAHPDHCSLNLSCAVQVIAYEIYQAMMDLSKTPMIDISEAIACQDSPPAKAEMVNDFHQHLIAVLQSVGFLDAKQPHQMLHRLRRLFARTQLEVREVNILRGILSAIQKQLSQS